MARVPTTKLAPSGRRHSRNFGSGYASDRDAILDLYLEIIEYDGSIDAQAAVLRRLDQMVNHASMRRDSVEKVAPEFEETLADMREAVTANYKFQNSPMGWRFLKKLSAIGQMHYSSMFELEEASKELRGFEALFRLYQGNKAERNIIIGHFGRLYDFINQTRTTIEWEPARIGHPISIKKPMLPTSIEELEDLISKELAGAPADARQASLERLAAKLKIPFGVAAVDGGEAEQAWSVVPSHDMPNENYNARSGEPILSYLKRVWAYYLHYGFASIRDIKRLDPAAFKAIPWPEARFSDVPPPRDVAAFLRKHWTELRECGLDTRITIREIDPYLDQLLSSVDLPNDIRPPTKTDLNDRAVKAPRIPLGHAERIAAHLRKASYKISPPKI